MKQNLDITCIQTALYWEDKQANLALLEEKIRSLPTKQDIIVLPEMFNTGFSTQAHTMAEPVNGHSFKWLKVMASHAQSAVCGSIMIKENSFYFNRFVFMQPNGKYECYDKNHLFSLTGEDKIFTKGHERIIINYEGWKICPLICYDLRFPEWSRNKLQALQHAFDVLIYSANWPAARQKAWDTLLPARAIENECYTIGVNIVGTDGNNIQYNGGSACYSPTGECIAIGGGGEEIISFSLSWEALNNYRTAYPFLHDAV